jgi:hypothetical protein
MITVLSLLTSTDWLSKESYTETLHRTFPIINRKEILYHPLIISESLSLRRFDNSSPWPKVWLGEPATVIHRVARRGLLESTTVWPIRVGGRGRGWHWQRGVPAIFQELIGELFRLWARPTPNPVRY